MKTEPNAFSDLTKIMQQFKVTGLDITPIIESRRKDMEALVEANKATYDAMQSLANGNLESGDGGDPARGKRFPGRRRGRA